MTGSRDPLQAFRLGDDGRQAAAVMSYSEMLRAGTTTACDVTVPFDGWLETMALSGMRFFAAPTFATTLSASARIAASKRASDPVYRPER